MRDESTGVYKILNQPGGIVQKTRLSDNAPTEYYIYYRWVKKNVNKRGRYQGMFSIYLHPKIHYYFPRAVVYTPITIIASPEQLFTPQ